MESHSITTWSWIRKVLKTEMSAEDRALQPLLSGSHCPSSENSSEGRPGHKKARGRAGLAPHSDKRQATGSIGLAGAWEQLQLLLLAKVQASHSCGSSWMPGSPGFGAKDVCKEGLLVCQRRHQVMGRGSLSTSAGDNDPLGSRLPRNSCTEGEGTGSNR